MFVEINILPNFIQKALMQGEYINFTNQGKIIASTKNINDDNQTLYEWAMAYNGVDVADIEIDEIEPIASKNRFVEFD